MKNKPQKKKQYIIQQRVKVKSNKWKMKLVFQKLINDKIWQWYLQEKDLKETIIKRKNSKNVQWIKIKIIR